MILEIKKMAKIGHFRELLKSYPDLDYYKIRTRTNFENPNGKSLDLHLNNVIYSKRTVPRLNRLYSGHFQNTPNIKTFFSYSSNTGSFLF